ncbi:MAG: acyl-CoA dehydrogenase, partial [Lewinella sp.]|nr:acyl-CoA dehydrogenase [Lewinella sp.]
EGPYGEEIKAVKDFKKAILMVAGGAAKMQMDGQLSLKEEQEILMNVANMMNDLFQAESILLRVMQLQDMDKRHDQAIYDAILRVFLTDATARIAKEGQDAVASFTEGDLQRTFLMGLKRYTKYPPANVKAARRLIASRMIEANAYCF